MEGVFRKTFPLVSGHFPLKETRAKSLVLARCWPPDGNRRLALQTLVLLALAAEKIIRNYSFDYLMRLWKVASPNNLAKSSSLAARAFREASLAKASFKLASACVFWFVRAERMAFK